MLGWVDSTKVEAKVLGSKCSRRSTTTLWYDGTKAATKVVPKNSVPQGDPFTLEPPKIALQGNPLAGRGHLDFAVPQQPNPNPAHAPTGVASTYNPAFTASSFSASGKEELSFQDNSPKNVGLKSVGSRLPMEAQCWKTTRVAGISSSSPFVKSSRLDCEKAAIAGCCQELLSDQ
ncbi:uncharacterized protein BDR25DRAFT_311525 [Lindgomyces ingoldianus]|uniref:Uncharacterized protein n=1 Tax=Lindgomyces ingoldianus TaxID=673940 RepID=A0ACB6R4Y2_9PLEO|nr:uncharacterized protein BDR25DRAFT_311525 [Lindgomyces ingoldianus]KAF2474135.1 hypothetical protein BDR25DRAFT_311525 [Lindgomyces ingoldianus]